MATVPSQLRRPTYKITGSGTSQGEFAHDGICCGELYAPQREPFVTARTTPPAPRATRCLPDHSWRRASADAASPCRSIWATSRAPRSGTTV